MKKQAFWAVCLLGVSATTWAQTEIRLAVHQSFALPKGVFADFEKQHDAKVAVIKMGGSNEMLNKLILSRAKPVADVVYGLDNANVAKAAAAGILDSRQPKSHPVAARLPYALAVNYGYVVINYDKKWFAEHKLPLPTSLEELATPRYRDLLVVPNPGTSSPGLAFLLANIHDMGEKKAFDWWLAMRRNGVKVTKSWSDAYYTDFTQNGGGRPLVVSYATSPAAEVYFSKGKYQQPPTGNLFLKGGVFRQVEGVAVLKGSKYPELARRLAAYLQNPVVQKSVPEAMWVYPAVKNTPLPAVFEFAQVPSSYNTLPATTIERQQKQWVSRWIRAVLK